MKDLLTTWFYLTKNAVSDFLTVTRMNLISDIFNKIALGIIISVIIGKIDTYKLEYIFSAVFVIFLSLIFAVEEKKEETK
ncbi:MAG: hypothetical protein L3J59_10390 [Methylococcaceae bacterium]|nr:hypothetical protein [Methylococcaceae bacterium]